MKIILYIKYIIASKLKDQYINKNAYCIQDNQLNPNILSILLDIFLSSCNILNPSWHSLDYIFQVKFQKNAIHYINLYLK